jgi:hypothetical protein
LLLPVHTKRLGSTDVTHLQHSGARFVLSVRQFEANRSCEGILCRTLHEQPRRTEIVGHRQNTGTARTTVHDALPHTRGIAAAMTVTPTIETKPRQGRRQSSHVVDLVVKNKSGA